MLSQENADKLKAILKMILDPQLFRFPEIGGAALNVVSEDKRELFQTDIYRGQKNPSKSSYNLRYKSSENTIIYRLDINGPNHRNPDYKEIPCPHLHIYRENYEDAWAIPAPDEIAKSNKPAEALIAFLRYCRIQNTSAIAVDGDLFE
jgi:hypothetical protein